jgi:hypothetical protein
METMTEPTKEEAAAIESRAKVILARDAVVASIRAREHYAIQIAKADDYRAAIVEHSKLTGRKLPVPSSAAVLRCFS